MKLPDPSTPFRRIGRFNQMNVQRALLPTSGRLKKLRLVSQVFWAVVITLLWFVAKPMIIERFGAINFLYVFIAVLWVLPELTWRFVQLPAVEKELELDGGSWMKVLSASMYISPRRGPDRW